MSVPFGEKLKDLRNRRDKPPKTQTEVGEFLGIGLRQYQRYENGTEPDLDKLIILSDLYKYDLVSHITNGKCVIVELKSPEMTHDSELKDKYIKLLEEREKELKQKVTALEAELTENSLMTRAYMMTILKCQSKIRSSLDKKDEKIAQAEINKDLHAHYEYILAGGKIDFPDK